MALTDAARAAGLNKEELANIAEPEQEVVETEAAEEKPRKKSKEKK